LILNNLFYCRLLRCFFNTWFIIS